MGIAALGWRSAPCVPVPPERTSIAHRQPKIDLVMHGLLSGCPSAISLRQRRLTRNSSLATGLQERVRELFFLGHGWGHMFDETSHFGGEVGMTLGLKDVGGRSP